MKISLLHATRDTPTRALAVRETWLSRAQDRDSVQHIFGVQHDDAPSIQAFFEARATCAITPAPPAWASSSVANWNAAAALATGDLLIVIADDLTPPIGWDETLRAGMRSVIADAVALFVPDQLSDDGLLRHPVMTRALYQKRGYIFDPDYYGVFCDNDLTTWCEVNRVPILRANRSALCWHHDHDMTGNAVTAQQNRSEAYDYGAKTYGRKWSAVIPRKVTSTHSVWIGERLSKMERLTLTMLAAHGHSPTLWVDFDLFEDFDNVPAGVRINSIPPEFPPAVRFAGIPHPTIPSGGIGSYAQWSDWFACWVLSRDPGALWCQLDIAAIKPIHAAANTFTTYSGGLSVCAFTLQPDLALACHRAMAAMVKEGMVGRDWHDTMRLVQSIAVESGAMITQFADFYDCGGRPSSPFNQPVAREDRPGLIHWSNATHGTSKDEPVAGSLYAELVEEYL
jgi:hypothetical protein